MASENVKQYFTKHEEWQVNGNFKCKFCEQKFAKGTSSTRLRAHLTGESKSGARSCPSVPQDVKYSLQSNKRQRTTTSASVGVQLGIQSTFEEQIESGANNHNSIPFSPEENNDFVNQRGLQLGLQSRYDEISQQNIVPFPNVTAQQIESGSTFQPNTLQTTYSIGMAAETMQPNESGNNLQHEESQTSDFFAGLEIDSLMVDSLEIPNESSTFQPNTLQATYSMGMVAETTQANESGNKSETSSNPHQIESGANNFSLNNDFGIGQHNQLGYDREIEETLPCLDEMLRDMISTPPNESGSVENLLESCRNLQSEAFPPTDLVTQDLRNCRSTDEADQHGVGDAEMVQQEVQMMEASQEGEGSAFQTKKLVGEAFVKNEGKIWSWLMDDQVLRVGIYGMGGVGKTTLMRQIQTHLEGQSSLKVYWVTVSKDFSIWKLQNLIAKKIGFNFSEKEDEVERAEELTQSLKRKGKCALILDDLWNCFNIDEVGIPVKVNACKLVLTTRLCDVCRQMDFREVNRIHLKPLSKEEAWILFTQELGDYIPEVEELAKAISGECGGLPLGIKVMARTMKEIHNVHIWRNALVELKEVKSHEMQEQVFSVLKFSFLRLKDPALQDCLSYCALFPEDERIEIDKLIRYMIVEGIIDERSRQAELDKGHTMLYTLENACLLEGDTKYVWMHDLIRDMVINELRERSKMLVEAGLQLKELPDVEKWTEDLVRVSLIGNELEMIPHSYTPRCPNLSTLLLCRNYRLKKISDSFFEQFQKLKVLDLSDCSETVELPGSISNLVNLTALLLSNCSKLIYVPSLVKLEKLKMLDLCDCRRLKEMPEGVKFLPKLNYLDLSLSGVKERESEISKFVGWEVGELRMLETFNCYFRDLKEFGEYIESQKRSQQSLSHYEFYIGGPWRFDPTTSKSVCITNDSFIDPLRLPTDIEALRIEFCGMTFYKGLFPPSLLSCLINLQEIGVLECDGIEEIFAVKEDNINAALVQSLLSYHSTHSLSNHSLLNLKVILIRYCHKLKKLFPPSLLPNLHNLQEIKVGNCHGMEEIFSTDQEDGEELSFGQSINNNHYPPNPASTSTVSIGLNLPKLTTLDLCDLPELRSIYKGAINCHSLQEIALRDCPKMERITLPLPQPSLRKIGVGPKEWWESVQWGSANDKVHLQSLKWIFYSLGRQSV